MYSFCGIFINPFSHQLWTANPVSGAVERLETPRSAAASSPASPTGPAAPTTVTSASRAEAAVTRPTGMGASASVTVTANRIGTAATMHILHAQVG